MNNGKSTAKKRLLELMGGTPEPEKLILITEDDRIIESTEGRVVLRFVDWSKKNKSIEKPC